MKYRECKVCHERKLIKEFIVKEKHSRSKIRYTCSSCLNKVVDRECNRCHEVKLLDEFGTDSNRPLGKHYTCKVCLKVERDKSGRLKTPRYRLMANIRGDRYLRSEKGKAWRAKWLETSGFRKRTNEKWLLKRYGITYVEWVEMYVSQEGKCAVCRSEIFGDKNTHTDHDHVTKKVRGLLCRRCNWALGVVKDSIDHLQSLIDYLRKSK